MSRQHIEQSVDLATEHSLGNIEKRLVVDIKRLETQLSRIRNDVLNPTRADMARVYGDMLETRRELLNQIQLQILSLVVERQAAV